MNVSLVLVQADGKQREVPIRKPVQIIGRQTDCQVRIPSANVSRHHCELSLSDDGQVSVRDLGSSNGTYVNKQRVTQGPVKAGDLLCLGGFVFVVKIDGKPSFIDSEDVMEDGLVEAGGSATAPESRPTAATLVAPPPRGSAAAKKPPLTDPSDDSSVTDFDFLGGDDDLKKQPKL
jgi:pSer/pThr/pTyr-binding forkhead associated (FHA) protein